MKDFTLTSQTTRTAAVPAFGTDRIAITPKGVIIDTGTNCTLYDPWRQGCRPSRRIMLPDPFYQKMFKSIDTAISYSQLICYTFYGYSELPIRLRYPDEVPVPFINCHYEIHENDFVIDGMDALIRGERFKTCAVDPKAHTVFVINRHGCIVAFELTGANSVNSPRAIGWVYNNMYAQPRSDNGALAGKAIHELVYDKWVNDPPRTSSYDVHHKDEHRWNNIDTNLQLIPHGEHHSDHLIKAKAEHGRPITKGLIGGIEFKPDDIRYICQGLQDGIPVENMIDHFGVTDIERRNAVRRLINRIRKKESYAYISAEYDFSKAKAERGYRFDEALLKNICEALMDTSRSERSIAKDLNASEHLVRKFRTGEALKHPNPLVRKYAEMYDDKIDHNPRDRHQARAVFKTQEEVDRVIRLLKYSNLTSQEIGDICGFVNEQTINDICNGQSARYNRTPIVRNFSSHDIRYKTQLIIPPECGFTAEEIMFLQQEWQNSRFTQRLFR